MGCARVARRTSHGEVAVRDADERPEKDYVRLTFSVDAEGHGENGDAVPCLYGF